MICALCRSRLRRAADRRFPSNRLVSRGSVLRRNSEWNAEARCAGMISGSPGQTPRLLRRIRYSALYTSHLTISNAFLPNYSLITAPRLISNPNFNIPPVNIPPIESNTPNSSPPSVPPRPQPTITTPHPPHLPACYPAKYIPKYLQTSHKSPPYSPIFHSHATIQSPQPRHHSSSNVSSSFKRTHPNPTPSPTPLSPNNTSSCKQATTRIRDRTASMFALPIPSINVFKRTPK